MSISGQAFLSKHFWAVERDLNRGKKHAVKLRWCKNRFDSKFT